MPGYHLHQPKNGSGKRSPFYRVNFSVGGRSFRIKTGERDPVRADIEGARLYLEAHQRARLPVPKEGLIQLEQRSLAELGAMYVVKVEDDIKSKRLTRNARFVKDIKFDLRHVVGRFQRPDQLTTTAWKDACGSMHDGYPEREGSISWRYIQRITITARALLRYVNELGVIGIVPELPAPTNEDVALEQNEGEPVTEEERDAFLAALRKLGKARRGARRARRIYVALFWSALRKSGLERLCLRQIYWKAGQVKLPPRKSKNKKERWIALHPKVAQAIRQELAERGSIRPDEPIFGKFDVRDWFSEAVEIAGIDRENVRPHHFTRTTAATIAGNKGASLAQLMALGTWDTPAMAMKYVKIDAERSREALELMDRPRRRRRVKAVRKKGA